MRVGRLSVGVENLSGKRVLTARLEKALRAAAKMEKISRGEWRVAIVGDAEMKRLHRRTMNIPTTTDVLTFDLRDAAAKKGEMDLDTVVCIDVAKRQAAERGHSVLDELTLYAVHSLLHVCGYDDLTANEAERMHTREDEVLRAIGVGAVYARARVLSERAR